MLPVYLSFRYHRTNSHPYFATMRWRPHRSVARQAARIAATPCLPFSYKRHGRFLGMWRHVVARFMAPGSNEGPAGWVVRLAYWRHG